MPATLLMKKTRSRSVLVRTLLVAGTSLALAAQGQPDPGMTAQGQPVPSENTGRFYPFERLSPDDWSRHFRLGALLGLNISADFKMSGNFGVGGTPPGVYSDGYVQADNTGNAGGFTSNWGYQNASQVSGSTLTMHSATSFSASGSDRENDDYSLGFDLGYGNSYWRWGDARIGWEFGFGWLAIGITDDHTLPASANQTAFHFDTGGIVLPTPGYQGTADSKGAPTIAASPSSQSETVLPGALSGSRKLDVSLFTFKLGPSVYFDLGQSFGLYASVGPALGLVSGDYKFNESIIIDQSSTPNTGRFGVTSLVYGGYASAVLVYHVPSERADHYLGAQYLPLTDATASSGGREVRLNLTGQVNISAGINWTF